MARRGGAVLDHGDHVVISTPSNPTYYFGNCLLFNRPPAEADYERWLALFAHAFAHDGRVRHVAFAWSARDGERGEVARFLAAGFTLNQNIVLTAKRIREAVPPPGIVIEELREDTQWTALLKHELHMRAARFEPDEYKLFMRRKLDERRNLCRDAVGAWIGAFCAGELVGSCGIFAAGELSRYQDVGVDERYRNRGIAKALLARAAQIGFERFHSRELVIVADAAYHALGLYERAGFRPVAREWALWKSP